MSRARGIQTAEYPAHAVCGNRHTACAGYITGREGLRPRVVVCLTHAGTADSVPKWIDSVVLNPAD